MYRILDLQAQPPKHPTVVGLLPGTCTEGGEEREGLTERVLGDEVQLQWRDDGLPQGEVLAEGDHPVKDRDDSLLGILRPAEDMRWRND